MKRIKALILACLLTMSICSLAACSKETSNKEVTIRYVAWNVSTEEDDENLERRMIDAYMAANQNVKIEVVENVDFDNDYMASLRNLATTGELPDVIMVSEVPVLLADGYLMNIKEIAEKDNEWSSIPKAVADSTHFGSGIYTVPSALFSYGFFVNDELFDAANVPRLDVGFEWSEMLAAVKALTNPAQQVLGLNEVTYFPDWIPHYLNDSLGHSTWDGEKFNLDSQEFITGIQWCSEILTGKYSYDALDEDEAAVYNAEWYGDVWAQGKLAVSYDATYSLPDYEAAQESFDSRFIGMPGNKNIVIPDFVGISSTCENPEAAFDFIKYMTFGKEGFLKRIELRDKEGYILESLPITNDQEVLDAYFANAFPGLEEAYATMDTTLIEGETVIPGYVAAMYEGLTGIPVELNGEAISNATVRDVINACMYGNLNIADYVGQLNRLANEKVAAMQAEIDEYVK